MRWLLAIGLWLAFAAQPAVTCASEYRRLPPATPTSLSTDWLIHEEQ